MKVTLDIDHCEEGILHEYGCVSNDEMNNKSLDIKVDWSQLYINGIEVISEKQIDEIGYYLTDSTSRGGDYPDKLIVCLGDDRKLGYGENNDWAFQFGKCSEYTFKEIFKMILTQCGTENIDVKYAENFKKHLIEIYDKTVKNIKKGDTK
tara:strand:- start:96 stop:545 length:450 start_codon:yes stop_codon:yes gene_type:complete